MDRIPEPELMDEDEQARAYAEADFEEPHAHCLDLLLESIPEFPDEGIAVDLGCGPGDITLRFARHFPKWQVDGIDGAAAMLHYGQQDLMRSGLSERVRLIHGYLPLEQFPRDSYDFIFSNSLLHHLADPMVLWNTVKQAGTSGTPVFIMDLARAENQEEAKRLVDEYAAGEPNILRTDFFHSLCAAYRPEEVQAQLKEAQLELEVRQVTDRHLIVWGSI